MAYLAAAARHHQRQIQRLDLDLGLDLDQRPVHPLTTWTATSSPPAARLPKKEAETA